MLKAKDAMSEDVIWTRPHHKLQGALQLMQEFKIRHLPVLNERDQIVGLLSEGDILLSGHFEKRQLKLPPNTIVNQAMSRNVITCFPSSPLEDVASTMISYKINCLPVVQANLLVGIITTSDILSLFCRKDKSGALLA